MKNRLSGVFIPLVLALPFLLSSCVSTEAAPSGPVTAAPESETVPAEEPVPVNTHKFTETEVTVDFHGDLSEFGVDQSAAETISRYFTLYYQSLGSGKAEDLSVLYSFGTDFERLLVKTAIDYQIEIRNNMDIDLSFGSCKVGLTLIDCKAGERTAQITLYENNAINYAFAGDITSYTCGVEHDFVLERSESGWLIVSHSEISSVFSLITESFSALCEERRLTKSTLTANQLADVFSGLGEMLVASAEKGFSSLKKLKTEYNSNKDAYAPAKQADNPYDAEAAVAYSYEWAGKYEMLRNPSFNVYDDYGGNCNNYTSQCLYAGGIPMDYRGDIYNQWKYYGPVVSGYNRPYGRAMSWTGVEEFYNYCTTNEGFGLVAEITENVYCARPGDIVQYISGERGVHSVIVSKVVYDGNGDVAELLVNSNTTDKVDSPMTVYGYTSFRLIRIIGWNN